MERQLTAIDIDSACRKAGAVRVSVLSLPRDGVEDGSWQYFEQWRADGCAGDMEWLGNYPEIRRQPSLLLPDSRTLIVCAFAYDLHAADKIGLSLPDDLSEVADDVDPYAVSSYALGDDYHDVFRKRLRTAIAPLTEQYGGQWRICVDSAPLMERYWALRAGIGVQGRNGTVIIPSLGAPVLLAFILTTLDVESCRKPISIAEVSQCINCGRCVEACPGSAISPENTDGLFVAPDASRCLSYLTIEQHTAPTDAQQRILATPAGRATLYGCDICQRVCPMLKSNDSPEIIDEFVPRETYRGLTLAKIQSINDMEFAKLFTKSPMKRAKHRFRT